MRTVVVLSTLAVFAIGLAPSAVRADEAPVSLRYEVNAAEVQQGESFQLDVVVTVRSQQPVEELALPEFPRGLTVVQERKSQSTQIGAFGGRRTVTTELRYMFLVRGDEAGTFKIPEATARLGKAVARTAPLSIKVIPESAAAAAAANTALPAGGVAGARFGRNPPTAFLEVTVDREGAWVGQQVTATTEVYTEQPLAQWPRLPPFKPPGFLCSPLLGDERPQPSQKSVAGHLYYVYLVNKDALFGLADGEVTLPAQAVDIEPAGSMFTRRALTVKSVPIKLKVKALPVDDRPARFAPGNVGQWQLTASVRPPMTTVDQPITLSLVATGTGSLEQLQMPTWDGGDPQGGARVFPSTTKMERRETSVDRPELGGRVIVEMLVQPQKEGDVRIPPLSLSYFDPDAGQYKTSTTQPIVVTVRPARGVAASTSSGNTGPRQTIARGARPLHQHVVAQSAAGEAPVAAGGVALLAGAAVFLARARTRKRSASVEGKRAAQQQLRQHALDDAKGRGDLAGVERVLLDALADRCGPAVKARATGDLSGFLEERGVERAVADDIVRFIRDVEAARYSPAGGERARLADAAGALIARLETP